MTRIDSPWYQNAFIYLLDVETFYDANGDGIGDFEGLTEKLDAIAGTGVTCLWLLPFYPSPNRDNGYDVTDYLNVDPRFGNLGDFARFLNKANALGLRVIIDLVVNHTSNRHPWFLEARSDPKSRYRNYYVWSDEPRPYPPERLMFRGEEATVWTQDEAAGQYYLHRFYKEQPDLNLTHPPVQDEIRKIMMFWLRLGVHGFRVDAAEIMVEPYGIPGASRDALFAFLDEMQSLVRAQVPDGLLLAEVNGPPAEMLSYFREGRRMHMQFNFFINQHVFLSLAKEEAGPLREALDSLPPLAPGEQWLHFLRHHDELNLKLLASSDQQLVLNRFAPENNMRIYGTGIRRRLAPLLDNDRRILCLAYSLLFSLPGAQMVRYGDEIGMGEDLGLEGRNAVRTPMQWAPAANGGFSDAPKANLVHPVIDEGDYSYEKVNVLSAQEDPGSLLNWLERLITTRRQCPSIGRGRLLLLPSPDPALLLHGYVDDGRELYFLHNFSAKELTLSRSALTERQLYNVFGEGVDDESLIRLPAYGHRWLKTQ